MKARIAAILASFTLTGLAMVGVPTAANAANHCPAGSRWIEAYNGHSGLYIRGRGIHAVVDLGTTGNCFHNIQSYLFVGAFDLQNGTGNCINIREADGLITLEGCDPNSNQQALVQVANQGGTSFLFGDNKYAGWMTAQSEQAGAFIDGYGGSQSCVTDNCRWLGVP